MTIKAQFTRPNDTTAYAAGDVVGPAVTGNLVFSSTDPTMKLGENVIFNRASLRADVAALPTGMGSLRLHLFDSAPTAIADNAAFNLIEADRDKYLGYIDFDTMQDLGDTLYITMPSLNFQAKIGITSTTLYGVLQTLSGYTPTASAVKTITLYTIGV